MKPAQISGILLLSLFTMAFGEENNPEKQKQESLKISRKLEERGRKLDAEILKNRRKEAEQRVKDLRDTLRQQEKIQDPAAEATQAALTVAEKDAAAYHAGQEANAQKLSRLVLAAKFLKEAGQEKLATETEAEVAKLQNFLAAAIPVPPPVVKQPAPAPQEKKEKEKAREPEIKKALEPKSVD